MSGDSATIDVEEIVMETDDAILVIFEGEEIWIPLSQVDAIVRGKNPAITAKRWLLEKKGLL